MKYIFWGGKALGNYILNGFLDNKILPTGIICYREELDKPIIEHAKKLDIEVLQIQKFKKEQDKITRFISSLGVDYYISAAFPFILSGEILNMVKYPINIHTSAVPKYRGHHPISAALLNDEPYQATTVHIMKEEVDSGEIILQDFIKITNEDTILTIRQRLIELSYKLVLKAIQQLESGTLYLKNQIGPSVWAPRRNPEDSKIDFSRDSRYLHNFIRALVDPYPNAFSKINGEEIKIKKTISSDIPGLVLAKTKDNKYVVSSGDGVIFIEADKELSVGDKFD